jgi:enterochelin esterase-like enzyme
MTRGVRRALGLVVALAVSLPLLVALVAPGSRAQDTDATLAVHQRFVRMMGHDGQPTRVVVTYPRRADGRAYPPNERYPVVVALHGRGEALKPRDRGALGWYIDYRLPDAFGALMGGRLTPASYRMLVRQEHLAMVNAALRERPFRGVMVVTPYVPDLSGLPPTAPEMRAYADWVAGAMLDKVREELPGAARTREGTGIDGVSLGGWVSLVIGFGHPERFGAVGAIQPAIRGQEALVARLATRARATAGAQRVDLLTSEGDPYRAPTEQLSTLLRRARVSHRMRVLPGPHDYVFNQGPGAIEMLRFFDEALAREAVGP